MNMTIEAQNALVTQTVAAMETIAAYTPTPTRVAPTALPTKIPTFTPSPAPPTFTPSPVAQTPAPEGTTDGTSGAEAAAPGTTPSPTVGPGGGQLPAGGLGMWGAVGAALRSDRRDCVGSPAAPGRLTRSWRQRGQGFSCACCRLVFPQ